MRKILSMINFEFFAHLLLLNLCLMSMKINSNICDKLIMKLRIRIKIQFEKKNYDKQILFNLSFFS